MIRVEVPVAKIFFRFMKKKAGAHIKLLETSMFSVRPNLVLRFNEPEQVRKVLRMLLVA